MSTLVNILLAIAMQFLGIHQAEERKAEILKKQQPIISAVCDSTQVTTKDTAVYLHHHPSKNEQQLNENNAL